MKLIRFTLTSQIRKINAKLIVDFEIRNEQNSQWIWITRKFANLTDWNHDRTLKFQQCNSNKLFNRSSDLISSYDSTSSSDLTSRSKHFIFRSKIKSSSTEFDDKHRSQISYWRILLSNHKLSKYSSQLKLTCSQSTSSSLNQRRRC